MKKLFLILSTLSFCNFYASELWKKQIYVFNPQDSSDYALACDISTTTSKIGLFDISGDKPKLVIEYETATKEIPSLAKHLQAIIQDLNQYDIQIPMISVSSPGTVIHADKMILHPHLPWGKEGKKGIDGNEILKETEIDEIVLLNDFEAGAAGVLALDDAQITTLQIGQPQDKKTKAVVGAGNGLGVGILVWDDAMEMHKPLALNYSFTEFGAHTELELKYYNFLEKNIGINAMGKVLGSTGGILEIYKFLDQQLKYKTDKFVEYKNYLDVFKNRHSSLRCKDAVEFFMKLYIRLIRNVAYAQNAVGGVYITNAIAENNPDLFENPDFLKELVDFNPSVSNDHTKYLKGYLARIPFYLIKNKSSHSQLYGAALYAQKQMQAR